MTMVADPVCGMQVDSQKADGQSRYQERTYYFCSNQCLRSFEANPSQYAGAAEGRVDAHVPRDKVEGEEEHK